MSLDDEIDAEVFSYEVTDSKSLEKATYGLAMDIQYYIDAHEEVFE